jgi:nanoRNase/pAp phosphatase (c-di-AMP/oligoRNAs hydrolase)
MSISKEKFKKVKSNIEDAANVLVCINSKSSLDTYSAAIAFVMYLRDVDKDVTVSLDEEPSSRYKNFFKKAKIKYKLDLDPLNYVISIDHSGGEIDKVSYDDEGGKFNLYITPSETAQDFDFDKVKFKSAGGDYDLIFVFGTKSLDWLGSLYKKNKTLFEENEVININNLKGAQDFGDIKLVDPNISSGEIIFKLLNGESTPSSDNIYQLLLLGILDYFQPMQRNDYKISTIETITSAVKYGADLKLSLQQLYFRRSSKYFQIVQQMFSNLNADHQAGVVWSKISNYDINQAEVSKDDIPLNGRIPFNLCRDFRVAFVLYEVSENEVWIEFESNEDTLDARNILSAFNPSGNEARVVFSLSGQTLSEVENEILFTLQNKLNLDSIVDSSGNNHLTGNSNNVNNISGSKEDGDGANVTPPPITPSS